MFRRMFSEVMCLAFHTIVQSHTAALFTWIFDYKQSYFESGIGVNNSTFLECCELEKFCFVRCWYEGNSTILRSQPISTRFE